jgi:hypothetical protein
MRSMVPCLACNRHVASDETVCPFCRVELATRADARACSGLCCGHASPRLNRAALIAAGAVLLCAACQGNSTVAPPYGIAPFPDSGAPHADASLKNDAAPDSGDASK